MHLEDLNCVKRKYSTNEICVKRFASSANETDNCHMEKLGKVIRKMREARGWSQGELASRIGVDTSQVSRYERGKQDIPSDNLREIAKLFSTSVARLFMAAEGIGEDDGLSTGAQIYGRIPLISTVPAGEFAEISDIFEPGYADEWIPSPVPTKEHTFALKVVGDSMADDYPEGTILVVEPDRDPCVGNLVIAKCNGNESTFKKWVRDGGKDYLKPLNTTYPMIPMDETCFIIGVVVFAGRHTA